MTIVRSTRDAIGLLSALLLVLLPMASFSDDGQGDSAVYSALEKIDAYPHAMRVEQSTADVVDHEVGLGALEKVQGVWRFKRSERLSGSLTRSTWQVVDGFTSLEVMQALEKSLAAQPEYTLLYSCSGRACGHPAQWANRVFKQRLLYGRQDQQRYAVYSMSGQPDARLALYASARTAERQYLQAERLLLEP